MPRRNRKRVRPNRRKFPKKRRRRSRGPTTLKVMKKIIPDRTLIKMRYVSDHVLNPVANDLATYKFSCNGMYDPDISGTGGQPYGYDQWMAFYNHFTVLGSKISVGFASANSDLVTGSALVGIATRANSTTLDPDSQLIREQPNTRWRYVRPLNSGQRTTVTSKFSARKFFGKPKGGVLSEYDLRGSTTSNPTEEAYWHIFAGGVIPSYDVGNITANVVITYVAMLTEPKEYGSS